LQVCSSAIRPQLYMTRVSRSCGATKIERLKMRVYVERILTNRFVWLLIEGWFEVQIRRCQQKKVESRTQMALHHWPCSPIWRMSLAQWPLLSV
jgi:polyphosphate kinase 2 (PPK2 family)